MDWNILKQKALSLKDHGQKLITQAQPYLEKATIFTEAQIRSTPVFTKSVSDGETDQKEIKKLIVMVTRKSDSDFSRLMLRLPQLLTKAWQINATLRIVDLDSLGDFAVNHSIQSTPTMIVSYDGSEYHRYTGSQEIAKWWAEPCFYDEK